MVFTIGKVKGRTMTERKRKTNGQGYTYKAGNSYRTVIRRNGLVVTAMAKTEQESKRLAKFKLSQEPNIKVDSMKPREKLTLSDFLLKWLDEEHQHNIAHTTYKRYRSLATHHIIPAIGHYQLTKLTPRLITELLSRMRKEGQGVRSQQQARALLSVALGEAENLDYIQLNPVRKVKNPQGGERSITPLKLDEVKRLLATYKGTYLSARLHIALLCGLRQGEALGLRWQDINFEDGTIEVKTQIQKIHGVYEFTGLKTVRSQRTVVLTADTLEALQKHHELIQSWALRDECTWKEWDLVFPKQDGNPRSPMTDYDEWQKALKLCGIAPRRLHDARHTAATLMYSQRVGIETISKALGHSSSAITSRLYVHSAEEPLRDAAERLNSLLN
jgi:integrase